MRSLPAGIVLGLAVLVATAVPAAAADYPPRDSGYHSYAEMVDHIHAVEAAHPGIVRVFSIGQSHEGRHIWAAEVSDNVGTDEREPEVLFDGLHHAREHLSAEMAIYILDLLADRYGTNGRIGRRVTNLVDKRRIWIVFMVDPDGLVHDLGGAPYRSWRKNRQPTPGSTKVGTDLNRNYGYRWGCCGGSSGSPGSQYFRGRKAWSAPEVRAMRDFVKGRVVGRQQRIRTHITFHTAGELVLWPYGYTRRSLPPDMTRLDRRALRTMGEAMADASGYRAKQSSAFTKTDGDLIDWLYARHRIFAFTFELYPRSGTPRQRHYPPDEIIGRETKRNRDAVLYLIAKAGCPYAALGRRAARKHCGPLFDDLEIARGWEVDPRGTDTATDGRWQRGKPAGGGLQRGDAASGRAVLVTGRAMGRDVDGRTTVRSRHVRLPAGRAATLRLRYWVGLSASARAQDGLRIHVVDGDGTRVATVLKVSGNGSRRVPRWKTLKAALADSLRGKRVAIELVAVDAGGPATVEAGVDQVLVTVG